MSDTTGLALVPKVRHAPPAPAAVTACLLAAPCAAGAPLAQVLRQFDSDSHADLRAVVVLREGALVAERYYNGQAQDGLHDMRSAGKSVTALLVGVAVARGQLATTGTVGQYWPEVAGSPAGKVVLDDLLTMRSGLDAFDEDAASPGNEDKLDEAPDPTAFVRGVPEADAAGTLYRYNSLGAYIAGRVVERASGVELDTFAGSVLFAPLGITRWQWGRDVAGHAKGQGNLSLTPRDMATHRATGAGRWRGGWQARAGEQLAASRAGAARGDRRGGPLRRSLWLFLVRQNL